MSGLDATLNDLGRAMRAIEERSETVPDDPFVRPAGDLPLEGETFHTTMMGYDSQASWYITKASFCYATVVNSMAFHKMIDLLMEDLPYCRVQVGNDVCGPYGMVFRCPDDSRLLLVTPKEPRLPEEFTLVRMTGDIVEDGVYYLDFSYEPPLAFRGPPEPVDPSQPAKRTMWLRDNWNLSERRQGWRPA